MKTRPRTPPSSSYAHLPKAAFDINLNDVVRRITLDDDSSENMPPQLPHPASHMSVLPPEILAEIFLYCIPQEQFPVPSCTEAPLLLTHVSSQWRDLALTIPDLWASLHINYRDPTEDIPAAELWLSRSGNRPLTLSVAIDFNEQPQQEILDTLCRHSKRWHHIRFDFRHLFCPPMYNLDLAQDDVPQLRAFEFHARDISSINVSQITHLLSSAPQLKEVTWVDDLADTDTLLELPLSRLTRLSLSMDHGTLDYLQLLHQCANLEHIRITRPLSNVHAPRPPVYLPKLASLNISYDLTGMLDHLILPALRDVRIYTENDKHPGAPAASPVYPSSTNAHVHSYPFLPLQQAVATSSTSISTSVEGWNPTALLSLIDRSACSIKNLSISPPMTEDTLLLCLSKMSNSLVELYVENVTVGDAFVGALTRKGWGDGGMGIERESLCPKLEVISLDTRVACSQGMLTAMVGSRLRFAGQSEADLPEEHDSWSLSSLKKIRVVDGHRDLERLKEFTILSLSHRSRLDAKFVLEVVPRRPAKQNTRNYFFRRKLCASR